jgi:hypothetical protein
MKIRRRVHVELGKKDRHRIMAMLTNRRSLTSIPDLLLKAPALDKSKEKSIYSGS